MLNLHNCKNELKGYNLKATEARLAVLKILENSAKPIDVTTIIEYLKNQHVQTDEVTVFRIIKLFTDRGLTRKVQLQEDKFRYELNSQKAHHHLVCQICGEIEDFSQCNIQALEKDIEKKKKFKVLDHSLEFFGVCSKCQK
ncbi:MAG TPA: Fur family transcriptional regulator [Patescibacteria group bacterium]|nr:Fur family transcriptional regulator [Patescibacteria group bacterium]